VNKDESYQASNKINIEQVIQFKCLGKKWGPNTSENKTYEPTGRQEGKQPFGLPSIEKIITHVPEEESMDQFKLAFEHEE